jgi:hypothetical protein
MAYGVILKHLEVDNITWGGVILKKKRGADGLFGEKEGRCVLFLTGVENTGLVFIVQHLMVFQLK